MKLREPTKQELGREPEKANLALQDSLQRVVTSLNRIPIVAPDGVMWKSSERVSGGVLVSGNNVIQHRLGRKPQGWIVVRLIGAVGDIYEVADSADQYNITLNTATGGQSVQIWFF